MKVLNVSASRGKDRISFLTGLMIILFLGGSILIAVDLWEAYHYGVTISWQVGSQIDTLGFNIYRRGASDAEFMRVNQYLITGNEDVLSPQTFSFQDTPPNGQRTYSYVIEIINVDGSVRRLAAQNVTKSWNPGWIFWIGFIMLLTGLGIVFTNNAWVRKAKNH